MRPSISVTTAAFLVLLRVAIGWHFFWEGMHKWLEFRVGSTESVLGKKEPFSSAGYFREAPGPLAKYLRGYVGDPDAQALGRLEVQPIPAGEDPVTYPPKKRVPPLLAVEWSDYVERFIKHYNLNEQQQTEARTKLDQAEAGVVAWLTKADVDDKTKAVPKSFQSAAWDARQTMPQRLNEYKAKLADVRDTQDHKLWLMGQDVEGKRLSQAKAELARLRTSILADLDEENTKKLEQALDGILTPEQKKNALPLPSAPPSQALTWINNLTMYGLVLLGMCMMVGLWTRAACLFSAGFLFLTYLCAPPFPWLPVPPNSEGYYFFVNKNVVEMLALLALGTSNSGRWFGVDALLHEVWSRMIRRRPPAGKASIAA
jgi:uncharacterized membrane protein YphA (DoxX/SURF4 family)